MFAESAYLYWLIVGCEAAFWLVLVLGLATRYLLHQERLSGVLLFSLPVVDLLLLAFTAMDLKAGRTATFAHGLATAYVGFTVAFGSLAVKWLDQRFAHWFAGGPPPNTSPSGWWPAVREDLLLWLRCILAWIIAIVLLIGLIAFVNDERVTEALGDWFRYALGSVFFWFLFGPLWSALSFWRALK